MFFRDAVGRTPLHMGAMSGNLDTCRKLVSAGALIDARDSLGRSDTREFPCGIFFIDVFVLFLNVDQGILFSPT